MSVIVGLARAGNHNAKQYRRPALLGSILLAVAFLIPSTSPAALLTYEGFPYIATGPFTIDGQPNDGTQASNGWDNVTWGQGLGGATSYIVTNGSLADPSGLLYTHSNCVYTAGGFAGRYNTTPGNWGYPGATYYFSILIKPANTPATTNFYGLQIFSNSSNTGDNHDLFVGKNGSGLNWGLEYSSNSISGNTTNTVYVDAYSGVAAAANQPVLLVVRVDFNFGSPDNFSLYVNPTPGSPEPAVPDATISDDIGSQNGIALSTGNGGAAFFDEVRLGATFASVTPTTGGADPDLLTWEPFAYNQGFSAATLDGQPSNGTQASNGWDNVTWGAYLGGATSYLIGNGSLADPSGKLVTSGNRTTTTGGFAGRFNKFPGYAAAGSTAYWSLLIRPENTPDPTNYYALQLFSQGQGDVLVGKNGSGPNWGLEAGAGTDSYSSVAATISQTVFLVVRADFGTTNDTFRLYVNPMPGATEPVTADATLSHFIGAQNGIGLNTGNGGAASFDEIRIGTNYADVTPAVAVVTTNPFNIVSIAVTNSAPYPSVVLTWATTGGNTNVVQATGGSGGSYNTNGFVNISGQMIIAGSGAVTTNYVDVGGATNRPARYYRIQRLP